MTCVGMQTAATFEADGTAKGFTTRVSAGPRNYRYDHASINSVFWNKESALSKILFINKFKWKNQVKGRKKNLSLSLLWISGFEERRYKKQARSIENEYRKQICDICDCLYTYLAISSLWISFLFYLHLKDNYFLSLHTTWEPL